MKKKFSLFLVLFFAISSSFAQSNYVKLVSSKQNETTLTFKLNSYGFKTVQTKNGKSVIVTADKMSSLMVKGAPDLPKFTQSIIIPDAEEMKIEIISSKYIDLDKTFSVAPSKGNLLRTVDPSTVPYNFGDVYRKNAFFPEKPAELGTPYILRDYRGETVKFFPFQYNPVTKKLRVYSEITVKISPSGKKGKNIFKRKKNKDIVSKEFGNIYRNHFLNYNKTAKYTPLEETGKMLIICNDAWTSAMQPFVNWKNKIGRPTEMVTVTTAGGTASAIKTYVENYYNTNGLTYLLLVGDAAQVPTNSGSGLGGDSDNAYGFISGNDHYQEIFVGRFSAETEDDVTTQVQRTIIYEDGSSLAAEWLNKTIAIASDQGPGDDNEYDYQHERNIQTDLIGFTYATPTIELFDGSQGGNDASGNPSPADVAGAVNTGGGIITYTGHGADTYWGTSGFGVSDINNLTNENKLPFIFDVACVNGNFVGQTCFGEAWLRAQNNGNPTGAIAICASTINQSWAPPMIAQDEMVDLLVGTAANGTKRTFSGLVVNGMFQMLDESSDNAMADTWTTFGDPSLYVRTDNPSAMAVTHDAVLIYGSTDFTVTCDFDSALVCLSKNGEIIGTAQVSGGTAQIPVSNVTPGDVLDVAVTGFNKITYQGQTTVTAPSGPYILLDSYDLSGNHNIDFGQTDNIDITLKNVGPDDATNITATLATTDAAVTATNNVSNISFGNIAGNNGTATVTGQFEITVSDNIEDQYVIPFTLTITDGTDTWESNLNVTVNAPAITIGDLFVTNDNSGDGRLDPGETGDINFTVTNNGHASADFSGTLSEASDPNNYLTLGGTNVSGVTLAAGASQDFSFTGASADANTPLGSSVGLQLDVTAGEGNQYAQTSNQDIVIGIVPIYPISDEGTLTVCTGTFYDSGLDAGDYGSSEDYTMTFMHPAGEDFIVVDFTEFDVESGYDYLHVYDGADINAPEISGSPFTGTNSPGTLMGANGLTFRFTSDGSVTHSGWAAEVSCYTPTAAPDCPENPVPADAATAVFPVKVSWDASLGATSYDVYFGTDTDPYTNSPVTVTSPEYNVSLSPNTTYYWAVLPTNSIGTGSGCDVWSFTTGAAQYDMTDGATITTCDGLFYDEGGVDNNYSNSLDQTMTFMPGTSGKMISVNFTAFDVEISSGGTMYDYLEVYDGTDAGATLIGKFAADDGAPVPTELQPVTATNTDGALTFVFHSDASVSKAGWEATVSCVDAPSSVSDISKNISIVPNPNNGLFTIKTEGLSTLNSVVEIYSVSGKKIFESNFNSSAFDIDLGNRAKGIYFIKITSGKQVFNSKLIIK